METLKACRSQLIGQNSANTARVPLWHFLAVASFRDLRITCGLVVYEHHIVEPEG